MSVYIEYAFLWNFLLDGVLLRLSLLAIKRKKRGINIFLASLVGAAFAVVFPLLSLPSLLSTLLKTSVGCLLCLIAFGRVKSKKERGMYALNCAFFFSFTFAFGGAILALFGENPHKGVILLSVAILTALSLVFIEKLYKKRAVHALLYDCAIAYQGKSVNLAGFYDSGNLATCKGLPVCFLSPDVFYELWGEDMALNGADKGEEEFAYSTLKGDKKGIARKGELIIEIKSGERRKGEVYFSPSANMVLREYKLLLPSCAFEQLDKINEK